jgi:predicted phosphoribosyltransferase
MARTIAAALGGEVDVVLVRKLGAPGNPEYAIGAIDESGWSYLNPDAAWVAAPDEYLAREKQEQLVTMRERRRRYTEHRAAIDPAGRTVIVVDDGLATGSTMITALHALRQKRPAKLVCAVPVAPPETLARVRPLADAVVCLLAPAGFAAVGQFYHRFDQVNDEDVIEALSA